MKKEIISKQLRLPKDLNDTIDNLANAKGVSVNAMKVDLLNKGLSVDKPRKIIFTTWNAVAVQDRYDPDKQPLEYDNSAREDCANFVSDFFSRRPTYQLIQLEFKKRKNRKGFEYLYGVRIWYSYPVGEQCSK